MFPPVMDYEKWPAVQADIPLEHSWLRTPSAARVVQMLRASLVVMFWFLVVYGGADWLTAQHSIRLPVALPWEQHIPLVSEMAWVYMSLYAMFLLTPCVLQSHDELRQFEKSMLTIIAWAGMGFVLFPCDLSYDTTVNQDVPPVLRWADWLNLQYNAFPSLHVGFSVICAATFSRRAPIWGRLTLWTWSAAIALSTLLTHQHHIADVIAGTILGLCGARLAVRPS